MVNVGILGAGEIAVKMAMTLQPLKGVSCYAVASRDYQKAQTFADKYGFERAYGSYGEMLRDEYVDVVYIATPHSHHYEHIKMCIERGKRVLCEKPICANAEQAEEIFALAEANGVFVTEAMWPRYMPLLDTILELTSSNIIGKITSMTANVGYPLENKGRLRRPELAGGALLDLGCYALHFASMIFGDELSGLSASCTYLDTGVDAQESITLTYPDGKVASLFVTMLAQADNNAVIFGTNGYIVVQNIINFETVRAYNLEGKVIAEYAAPLQVTGFEYEVIASIDAIRNGYVECPELPHATSLHIIRLMDSLREAWNVKFPFEINPELLPTELGEAADKAKKESRESSVKEISNTAFDSKNDSQNTEETETSGDEEGRTEENEEPELAPESDDFDEDDDEAEKRKIDELVYRMFSDDSDEV